MTIDIREFKSADYDAAIALWRAADGVTLRGADSRDAIDAYLARNAGLSFVAVTGGRLVGAVLCGTDGRRGYLNHLAVAADCRRAGIGRQLAERCAAALASRGIRKCHLMVVSTNDAARSFWMRVGWLERGDVILMSRSAPGAVNP
ncbi:MAG: GNAT family N-acetyltransferase [Gemmatimonadales bacterium]